jgi:hypothetical protein
MGGVTHARQSIKFFVISGVSIAHQNDHGPKLECAEVDNADAKAVAWAPAI